MRGVTHAALKLSLSLCKYYLNIVFISLIFDIFIYCIYFSRPPASNRVFTEGTCKLLILVISDLVDEDVVLHRRPQAVSALMFGTIAFLSKPGQTIAPLLGTWLLSMTTGESILNVSDLKLKSNLLCSRLL